MEILFGLLIMASVPGYFVIQPMALRSWSGGWHLAAVLPLVIVVPALLWSLFALSQGSNIWPLTLIFATMLGTIYLAALWVAQRFV
jgi:hypothetical protein